MKKNLYRILAGTLLAMLVFYVLPALTQEIRIPGAPKARLSRLDGNFAGLLPATEPVVNDLTASELGEKLAASLPDDLPVGDVAIHKAAEPVGTVIYVPQNHRYPGTDVNDGKNDSAELTQGQIYEVLEFLYKEYGIDYVMTEGELYGQVPEEKIALLKEKIALREKLAGQVKSLEADIASDGNGQKEAGRMLKQANAALASLDREIILAGAAHKLKAEKNEKVSLFGSEKDSTQKECAAIVRDYIYLNDRLETCSAPGGKIANAVPAAAIPDSQELKEKLAKFKAEAMSSSGGLKELLGRLGGLFVSGQDDLDQMAINGLDYRSLLGMFNTDPVERLVGTLKRLKEWATLQGDAVLAAKIGETEETGNRIIALKAKPQTNAQSAGPSRQDNPYRHISDPAELEGMIAETEKKIEEKVVDQRNRETAEYFAQSLKEQGETVGILQYGAGHEEGLIKELNGQGLDVVVVKPDEVVRREEMGEE